LYLKTWGGTVSAEGVVGRDHELAAVAAFLDRLPSGPCGLLLEGEAGIGKTTLWRTGSGHRRSPDGTHIAGIQGVLDVAWGTAPLVAARSPGTLSRPPASTQSPGAARDARCLEAPARLTSMQCTASSAWGPGPG
jgi:hypothetical protein